MCKIPRLNVQSLKNIPRILPAILIISSIAIFVIGLAACDKETSVTSKPTTSVPTTNSPTATSSQAANISPFSQADLTLNGIHAGATPAETEKVLGAPLGRQTEMDQVTGFDIITDTYEGLRLVFTNNDKTDDLPHLKYVEATDGKYLFARDIKVGDSIQAVIRAFSTSTDGKDYNGYTVIYGDPVQLDEQDTSGEIAFAYYNDTEIRFVHIVPPYMSGKATVYDVMSTLNLTIENRVVTKIVWSFGPGAE